MFLQVVLAAFLGLVVSALSYWIVNRFLGADKHHWIRTLLLGTLISLVAESALAPHSSFVVQIGIAAISYLFAFLLRKN